MPAPTNVSLSGIIGWARTNSGAGVNPSGQDINADLIDGKHYGDLKTEWETFAQSAGGGGCVAFGDSTFVGNGSYRTITFSPNLGAIDYVVSVMPTANTSSYVGEIWWTKVSGASFRVYNAGSGTTAFRWAVMLRGQMPDLAGAASGDIAGNYPGPMTVDGLQGRTVSSTAPSTGQVLTWNGSSWAPTTPASGGVTSISAGTGISVSDSTGAVTISSSVPSTAGQTANTRGGTTSGGSAQINLSGTWSGVSGLLNVMSNVTGPVTVALGSSGGGYLFVKNS